MLLRHLFRPGVYRVWVFGQSILIWNEKPLHFVKPPGPVPRFHFFPLMSRFEQMYAHELSQPTTQEKYHIWSSEVKVMNPQYWAHEEACHSKLEPKKRGDKMLKRLTLKMEKSNIHSYRWDNFIYKENKGKMCHFNSPDSIGWNKMVSRKRQVNATLEIKQH